MGLDTLIKVQMQLQLVTKQDIVNKIIFLLQLVKNLVMKIKVQIQLQLDMRLDTEIKNIVL
jgi:hypothetical protein